MHTTSTFPWAATALTLALSLGTLSMAQAEPGPPRPPRLAPPAVGAIQPGAYRCDFAQGDVRYSPFRCEILAVMTAGGADKISLEKLTGSQRIRGKVLPTPEGFAFVGEFFCPRGDCTQTVTGKFSRTGRDRYEGELNTSGEATRVRLWRQGPERRGRP